MKYTDRLRPPDPDDRYGLAYKDWLHVNLFDPPSRTAVVLNASLHGPPGHRRSVASATALIRHDGRWTAHCDTVSPAGVQVDDRAVTIGEQLEFRLDPVTGGVEVAFRHPNADIQIELTAAPITRSIATPAPIPFGSGWICWRAVPLLQAAGEIRLGGRRLPLDRALAYHDHNWGRWHWGDNIGWEWSALLSGGGCLVLSRATNRHHRAGSPNITVALPTRRGWRNWSYGGGSVQLRKSAWTQRCIRRLPGAMAALHAERMSPRLPGLIEVAVDDGFDNVTASIEVNDAIQVIAADPHVAGYSFIHELFGPFKASGTCGGHSFAVEGEGVFEHVD